MGTGWRRAFCTTIPRDRESHCAIAEKLPQESSSPSPRKCVKLGFLSSGGGGSNPSTPRPQEVSLSLSSPRLHCRTTNQETAAAAVADDSSLISPKLHCKTTPKSAGKSNPSSPRSPFTILRNSFRLSRGRCGVCIQSVKTGQGMAIYTAECAHAFHFPCIAAHVRKNGSLVCPVCNASWKDVPLLAIHKAPQPKQGLSFQSHSSAPKQELQSQPSSVIPSLLNLKTKSNRRAYDDDEPLLTSATSIGFIPIPEVEEKEEEDDAEEFRGFFANPVSSSSEECGINGGYLRNLEVSLMPEVAVVSVGRSHESYAVVLKIKAPGPPPAHGNNLAHSLDASCRAPIDLVTVLDVSGSMSGAKLQMMKRAMRLVISSLRPSDRLSILAFSAAPKRLLPLRRMTAQGQRTALRTIDRLVTSEGAWTCLSEALNKATKVLEDRRERNPVASIMLLSDGQDEKIQSKGLNQQRGLAHESSTRFVHMEIPVQSFGLGVRSGYTPEPSEDNFAKCVSGLLSVVVQDLRIELALGQGSDPAEISAVYSCNGRPNVFGSKSIRLGDLYAEEERELLVELRVPAPVVGSHHVLSVRCSYREPSGQDLINGREQALLVPRPQAVRSLKLERLRSLFITTRAIAESRRLIEHSELSRAHQLLASARALLLQSGPASAEEFVCSLEAELAAVSWRWQYQMQVEQQVVQRRVITDENGEPLTPTSAWRAAEQLAKMARMKKSMNKDSDLHGFENARF